jgi:CDGSH-type Zn-finger protein
MGEPRIAERRPIVVELEPGTYWWCACGRSENQPFCDESHKGTEFSPVEFVVERKERMVLCRCKRTGTPPRCDGTHRTLRPAAE